VKYPYIPIKSDEEIIRSRIFLLQSRTLEMYMENSSWDALARRLWILWDFVNVPVMSLLFTHWRYKMH